MDTKNTVGTAVVSALEPLPGTAGAVENSASALRYIQQRQSLFQKSVQPAPLKVTDLAPSHSLEQYQTPFQNQGARGTCWAFAAAAALEAAYKRQYGITLHLSEEYIFHVEKTVGVGDGQGNDLPGPRETNCSYWDFQGASDVALVMSAYAVTEARYAPYVQDVETLRKNIPSAGSLAVGGATQEQIDAFEYSQALIPMQARWNARYRVLTSKTVWSGSSTQDKVASVKAEIANNREVLISLDVGHGGDDNLQASPGIGGHVTLVVGYDDNQQRFQIKNSWFAPVDPVTNLPTYSWISYATARQYINAAHCITAIADPNQGIELSAAWRGVWNMDHDGWHGRLVIRRDFNFENYAAKLAGQPNTLSPQQNSVRLGSYYLAGKRHDVNGHFENGGGKIVFFVADGTAHVPSGQETGQRFEAYLFSRDFTNAAGRTTWNNTPFGVVLSRNRTPGLPDSFTAGDWVGIWAISHDGWQGTLQIIAEIPIPIINTTTLTVAYTAADGTQAPATASLGSDPHALSLTVQFSAALHQPFTLFAHTHEKGVFSGTTTQNGNTYGVKGFRLRPIYVVQVDGSLAWYRHDGRVQGSTAWTGPRAIGTGWSNMLRVFPGGDGIIYGVRPDGSLNWYRHLGEFDGSASFPSSKLVGSGWQHATGIVGGGNGVIYAIEADGSLNWYRHDGRGDGSATWTGPIKIGEGWNQFTRVFSGGDGILYGVKPDGTLVWQWHYGYADGSSTWSAPATVGTGWGHMIQVFAAEDGVIYAVEPDGTLLQYTHSGRFDGSSNWIGARTVGSGWQHGKTVFAS